MNNVPYTEKGITKSERVQFTEKFLRFLIIITLCIDLSSYIFKGLNNSTSKSNDQSLKSLSWADSNINNLIFEIFSRGNLFHSSLNIYKNTFTLIEDKIKEIPTLSESQKSELNELLENIGSELYKLSTFSPEILNQLSEIELNSLNLHFLNLEILISSLEQEFRANIQRSSTNIIILDTVIQLLNTVLLTLLLISSIVNVNGKRAAKTRFRRKVKDPRSTERLILTSDGELPFDLEEMEFYRKES